MGYPDQVASCTAKPSVGTVDQRRGDWNRMRAWLKTADALRLLKRRPDFPLRGFVRCAACDRGLTGSWSKGRTHYYAYYHCRPGCAGLNVTKAKLEGLFVDELARLQPSAGYMRLLKDSV